MTPTGSCRFPQVMGLGIPHGQGKTPTGISAPQTRFGGLVPAPEHPTHPTATTLGSYLGARCSGGSYGRSRGCATHPNHFMGWRGPAGRRVTGSVHPPAGHPSAPGTHRWVTRQGRTVDTLAPPTPAHSPACCRQPSPYLPRLFFYCRQSVSSGSCRAPAEHPLPSAPLGGPASSSGTTPGLSHLSPSFLGEAKTPRDDFPGAAAWVCSFPCVA